MYGAPVEVVSKLHRLQNYVTRIVHLSLKQIDVMPDHLLL